MVCWSVALQPPAMQQCGHRRFKAIDRAVTMLDPHHDPPILLHYGSGSLMRIKVFTLRTRFVICILMQIEVRCEHGLIRQYVATLNKPQGT